VHFTAAIADKILCRYKVFLLSEILFITNFEIKKESVLLKRLSTKVDLVQQTIQVNKKEPWSETWSMNKKFIFVL